MLLIGKRIKETAERDKAAKSIIMTLLGVGIFAACAYPAMCRMQRFP